MHKTVSLLVLSPRIQCLRQSHTAGSPRTGPCLPAQPAPLAEQALGARLLIASLLHPAVPHRVGPHPSDPVSPRPAEAWSQPQSSYPAALQPCPRVGAAALLDLARTISPFLPQTLSPHPGQSLPLPLCLFFSFNVPVLISLSLQTVSIPCCGEPWPLGLSSLRFQ